MSRSCSCSLSPTRSIENSVPLNERMLDQPLSHGNTRLESSSKRRQPDDLDLKEDPRSKAPRLRYDDVTATGSPLTTSIVNVWDDYFDLSGLSDSTESTGNKLVREARKVQTAINKKTKRSLKKGGGKKSSKKTFRQTGKVFDPILGTKHKDAVTMPKNNQEWLEILLPFL